MRNITLEVHRLLPGAHTEAMRAGEAVYPRAQRHGRLHHRREALRVGAARLDPRPEGRLVPALQRQIRTRPPTCSSGARPRSSSTSRPTRRAQGRQLQRSARWLQAGASVHRRACLGRLRGRPEVDEPPSDGDPRAARGTRGGQPERARPAEGGGRGHRALASTGATGRSVSSTASSGSTTGFSGCTSTRCHPHAHTETHKHGEAIVYVLSGRGLQHRRGEDLRVAGGRPIFVKPGQWHQHFNRTRSGSPSTSPSTLSR